eukprot:Rmarinus@m.8648
MARKRGAFIVLEGMDRSGKSTQVQRLTEKLVTEGISVENMRFPDRSTTIGQMINAYLTNATDLADQSIHLLFSANRWELQRKIESMLQNGTTIICDRYAFSGVAYTSAKGLDLDWCMSPEEGLPAPDAVLFLQLPPSVAESRASYGEERYEKREFQEVVRKQFELLGTRVPDSVWKTVDASGSIDEVTHRLMENVVRTMYACADEPIQQLWWSNSGKS